MAGPGGRHCHSGRRLHAGGGGGARLPARIGGGWGALGALLVRGTSTAHHARGPESQGDLVWTFGARAGRDGTRWGGLARDLGGAARGIPLARDRRSAPPARWTRRLRGIRRGARSGAVTQYPSRRPWISRRPPDGDRPT